ncbi:MULTISPECIES: hypothetical protein [Luteimonas]|uniref:hypothetical protein n=1 Tax=Luteimonas TaxID=83614 RepID=UPI000C795CC0|nr:MULTISPECIES: hypothetical protein [Luteimonas]
MPRAKKPALPPSNTSHLFGGRKPNDRGAAVTSARIADDLADFRKSGGRIEVLGVTRTLMKVDAEPAPPPKPEAAKPRKRRES